MLKILYILVAQALARPAPVVGSGQSCANYIVNFSVSNFTVSPNPVPPGAVGTVNMTGIFVNPANIVAVNVNLAGSGIIDNYPTNVNQQFTGGQSAIFIANFTAEPGSGVWNIQTTLQATSSAPQLCWQFGYSN